MQLPWWWSVVDNSSSSVELLRISCPNSVNIAGEQKLVGCQLVKSVAVLYNLNCLWFSLYGFGEAFSMFGWCLPITWESVGKLIDINCDSIPTAHQQIHSPTHVQCWSLKHLSLSTKLFAEHTWQYKMWFVLSFKLDSNNNNIVMLWLLILRNNTVN